MSTAPGRAGGPLRLRAARRSRRACRRRRDARRADARRSRSSRIRGIGAQLAADEGRRGRAATRSRRPSRPVAALIAANPHATYARIAALLHPAPTAAAGRASERDRRFERARSIRRQRSARCAVVGARRPHRCTLHHRSGLRRSGRRGRSAPTRGWSRASRSCNHVVVGARCVDASGRRHRRPTASGSRPRTARGSRCRRSAAC